MDQPERADEQPGSRYGRIHRLLGILTLIRSGRATTPAELAAVCGVSERTIFRDLKEIEGAGFRVSFHDGRYQLSGERFLPPVQLGTDEAMALAVLCGQIAGQEQIPFTAPAWRGLAKLLAGLPAAMREEVAAATDTVCVRTAASVPADGFAPIYEQVRRALAERRTLACKYDSLNPDTDNAEEFDFDPYALFFSVRAWYAVGFHHGRGAVRTLKINRFTSVRPTHRAYTLPPGFSLDEHLGNAWRMMRGEPDYRVAIRFDAEFAETIADTLWHRTQETENLPDGGIIFRCTVSGLDEIVWWVLSMGRHCEVLEPAELRERVREETAAALALYGGYGVADAGRPAP